MNITVQQLTARHYKGIYTTLTYFVILNIITMVNLLISYLAHCLTLFRIKVLRLPLSWLKCRCFQT